MLLLQVACSRQAGLRPQPGPWDRPLAERAQDPFPRRYTGLDGRSVGIAAPPVRIVSGTILSDSVLLAICPSERVQAMHRLSTDRRFSTVAAEAERFPRLHDGDPERILAARPDLVFIASFSRPETQALLAQAKVAVVRIDEFASVEGIVSNLRAIGYVLGLDAGAEGLVEELQDSLAIVAKGRAARAAWNVLLWSDGQTAGQETIFDSLLGHVGARNAAAAIRGHGTLRSEAALALDPDALVLGAPPDHEREVEARVRQDPAIAAMRCVRMGRLIFVPEAELTATSHHAARVAQRLAARLDAWGRP